VKFIGDLKSLSANLRQNYNKFYNYKGLVSVCYDASVKISLGADHFFVGNLNIFNKKELMNELKLKNEENEDFDLLYRLIKSKGINQSVNEIDGKFSFVFFDSNERNLYLIRDKAGIFPLYYTIYNENLIFSSFIHDIPKLLNHPTFSERGLFEFVYMNYFYAPDTFYKDIYEVPIGSILKYNIDTKIVKCIKYYDFQFQFNNIENRVPEEEYAKQLREKIIKAIGKRIKYDTKNGVLLSGGVDSVAMAIAMREFIKASDIVAYCVSTKGSVKDECPYAESIAKKLGIGYTRVNSDPKEILGNLDNLIINSNRPTRGILFWSAFDPFEKDINWFTGQDTRLHTPAFNEFDKMIYYFYHNDRILSLTRRALSSIGNLFTLQEVNNSKAIKAINRLKYLNNLYDYIARYILHYSDKLASKCDLQLKIQTLNYFYAYIQKYVSPKSDIRNFYNDIVKVRWRGQWTDEIREIQSIFYNKDLNVQFPYYDIELAEFSSKIPFNIANKSIKGKGEFSQKSARVKKYLLRKAFEREFPPEVLYRKKAVTDTACLYFNNFMSRKIKEKFSSSAALKDPVFVKLGFNRLAAEFNDKEYSINNNAYLGRIFNLYSLCLYYESLKGAKRER